jgi:PIN domain nuclease of toxin-antitoxin system
MIVADTHIILWDALEPDLLSAAAKKALDKADNEGGIIFCEISLWEIAMLMQKGRVSVKTDYQTFIDLVLQSRNYVLQNLVPAIAERSVSIDLGKDKDPADRIIAATAAEKGVSLITADQDILASAAVKTVW